MRTRRVHRRMRRAIPDKLPLTFQIAEAVGVQRLRACECLSSATVSLNFAAARAVHRPRLRFAGDSK